VIELYVIAGLSALLCFERIWSTITITRLVNRLMSRNYNTYVESEKKLKEPKIVKETIKIPVLSDDIAHDVNAAINSLNM
jgi:hypothetical protein